MRNLKFRIFDSEIKKYIDISASAIMLDELNNLKPNLKIEQFTGLYDKNGKEIYEGDIIKSVFTKLDGTKNEITGIVEYDKYNPCFVIHYKFNGNGHDCYEYDFIQCEMIKNEVIGNIYDNPDLLNK